jgi:hypothetical protein
MFRAPVVTLAVCLLAWTAANFRSTATANQPEDDEGPVFAFVALNKLTRPSADQVRAGLAAALPKEHKIGDVEIGDNGVTFSIDGRQAMYGFMEFPIPWEDLETPCKASWIWPSATKAMKPHKAHLIVFLLGDEGTQLERCVLLTKLLSAASRTFDTAGIYWGHGSVVIGSDQLQKMAEDASTENPPLLVWINFWRQRSEDGSISVFTEGLEYFDCKEIEVIKSKLPFPKIINTVMGVAHITVKGEVIKDGDTVGSDNQEKIKTRHAKSVRDAKRSVLRIEL